RYLEDTDEGGEEIRTRDLWHLGRFLRPFARPYLRPLLILAAALVVETFFNFSFPLATQYLIDDGLIQRNVEVLVTVLCFLAAAAVIVSAVGLACDYLAAGIFSGMVKDVRQRLFDHLQTLSIPFYTRSRSGEVLSRFSGDLVALDSTLVSLLPW